MAHRLTLSQAVEASTALAAAQAQLLDYSGHIRAGIGRRRQRELVREIQALRASLGWKPLDMAGRGREDLARAA